MVGTTNARQSFCSSKWYADASPLSERATSVWYKSLRSSLDFRSTLKMSRLRAYGHGTTVAGGKLAGTSSSLRASVARDSPHFFQSSATRRPNRNPYHSRRRARSLSSDAFSGAMSTELRMLERQAKTKSSEEMARRAENIANRNNTILSSRLHRTLACTRPSNLFVQSLRPSSNSYSGHAMSGLAHSLVEDVVEQSRAEESLELAELSSSSKLHKIRGSIRPTRSVRALSASNREVHSTTLRNGYSHRRSRSLDSADLRRQGEVSNMNPVIKPATRPAWNNSTSFHTEYSASRYRSELRRPVSSILEEYSYLGIPVKSSKYINRKAYTPQSNVSPQRSISASQYVQTLFGNTQNSHQINHNLIHTQRSNASIEPITPTVDPHSGQQSWSSSPESDRMNSSSQFSIRQTHTTQFPMPKYSDGTEIPQEISNSNSQEKLVNAHHSPEISHEIITNYNNLAQDDTAHPNNNDFKSSQHGNQATSVDDNLSLDESDTTAVDTKKASNRNYSHLQDVQRLRDELKLTIQDINTQRSEFDESKVMVSAGAPSESILTLLNVVIPLTGSLESQPISQLINLPTNARKLLLWLASLNQRMSGPRLVHSCEEWYLAHTSAKSLDDLQRLLVKPEFLNGIVQDASIRLLNRSIPAQDIQFLDTQAMKILSQLFDTNQSGFIDIYLVGLAMTACATVSTYLDSFNNRVTHHVV